LFWCQRRPSRERGVADAAADGQADFILEQLGLPAEGTLVEKVRTILRSCGVVVLTSETWVKAQQWRLQGGRGVCI
jgi:hypothetical protein